MLNALPWAAMRQLIRSARRELFQAKFLATMKIYREGKKFAGRCNATCSKRLRGSPPVSSGVASFQSAR
jgi:hypothetical protein